MTPLVISSYVLDWIIVIVTAVIGYVLGNITPNKRPFQLEDPDISYVSIKLLAEFRWGMISLE